MVAALVSERWGSTSPATWNTRRVADNTRAIPLDDLEELLRQRSVPLREKTLWSMLYETAARASEVLALDVEDLDLPRRRARIRSKGGSTDMVLWAAPIARLLGRYLACRDAGLLFLTRWRTRTAPARWDLYAPTGRARLSYRTAPPGCWAGWLRVDDGGM